MYFESINQITPDSITELSKHKGYLLIFVAEKSADEVENLIKILNQNHLKFFGGIYPTIIQETQNFDKGILLIPLPNINKIQKFLVTDSLQEVAIDDEINTAVLLIDAMIAETDLFLRKIYGVVGNRLNLVGGGAGFISFQQKPCLFTNDGLFEDGAIIAFLNSQSKLGVKHGWEVFAGPFIATDTEKNIIKELNWRPAFEVYKEVIEEKSQHRFSDNNFFEIAKIFPFGIYKEGTEYIVRDPFVVTQNNEIECISEVPENSTLQILTGNPEMLIEGAKAVAKSAYDPNAEYFLVFECISRVLFLGDHFEKELKVMNDTFSANPCKIWGVSTLGEIASNGTGFLDFYNKTIVVSSLIN